MKFPVTLCNFVNYWDNYEFYNSRMCDPLINSQNIYFFFYHYFYDGYRGRYQVNITYTHQTNTDDDKSEKGCEPPSHLVSKGTEKIRSNQIRYAGGQERDSLLPAVRIHCIHHPDGQRWLQHCYAHICESYGTYISEVLLVLLNEWQFRRLPAAIMM